jgi:hypothetical protein
MWSKNWFIIKLYVKNNNMKIDWKIKKSSNFLFYPFMSKTVSVTVHNTNVLVYFFEMNIPMEFIKSNSMETIGLPVEDNDDRPIT